MLVVLRGLSSIGRRRIVTNLIYKSPNRILTTFCQHHQPLVKLIPVEIYNNRSKIVKCQFHTTQRLYVPPVLVLLIRPLTRIGAFLFGRLFKRWWSRKTPEEKERYKKWFTARRNKIYGTLGLLFVGIFVVYALHLENDPLTGRTRFIILNEEQQNALGQLTLEAQLMEHGDLLLPATHPAYSRLTRVTERLLKANEDLPQVAKRKWSLAVINSDLKNAFVLPNGSIFVFQGLLNMTENDDQLATVLAHEIAHALLLHHFEKVSRDIMLDILLAIPIAITWALFPDLLAFALEILGINIADILLTLPYSRELENEADDIGLMLAARACFDVREAVVFWGLMKSLTELNGKPEVIPWLSTHPHNEDRERNLSKKLPEALDLRTKMKCPKLNRRDPIQYFNLLTIKEREAYVKYQSKNNLVIQCSK